MGKEDLIKIMGKAIVDRDFLAELRADPNTVAKREATNLTNEELDYISSKLTLDELKESADTFDVKYDGLRKTH